MTTVTRPVGGYTPTNPITNATKYQDDSAATTPKVAISSAKVDGDFNKAFDVLTDHDNAIAALDTRVDDLEAATHGTVTSVSLTAPAEFTVTGSPVTTSGTLAITSTSQTANKVYASPNGSSGAMSARPLVAADLPTLAEANLPVGTVVQQASTNKTDSFTTTSTSYTDITGFSISVTPVNSADKVMVRAVMQVASATAQSFLQLVRDTTPIGIGSAAGSRTVCSASVGIAEGFATQTVVIEYLDSPATTSNVNYKVQAKVNAGGTFLMNRCASDSDSAARPTTASTISFQRSARG